MREHQALERNMLTAQLSARLLDEQCNTAGSALRLLAARYALAETLRSQDRQGLEGDVREMVNLLPGLVYAAVCDRNGRILTDYPETFPSGGVTYRRGLFKKVIAAQSLVVSDVVRLPDAVRTEAFAMTIPLGRASRPVGFLMTYYRVSATESWLRRFGARDGVRFSLATPQGRVVAASGNAGASIGSSPDPDLLRYAQREREGSYSWSKPGSSDRSLVGFALASTPGWYVFVSQQSSTVQAGTSFLYPSLTILTLVVLAMAIVASRTLVGLYESQETMRQRLAAQNERLLLSDNIKSEFLANVSHDLWTPLSSLQISISGLLEPTIHWRPEQIRESLQLARNELEQMIARVRNLLEMARLDTNSNTAQKEPCDLVDLVAGAMERLGPLLRDRQVYADFPPVPLMIECRHGQFEIVILNLLENALKYSPPGSPLTLKGEKRGSDIYFSLRDAGSGVDPGEVDRIFSKFYRAQKNRRSGGTGLGLAICKAVIEEHGGVIGVFNAPGGGAEFWFSVPCLPVEKEAFA